MTKINEDAKRDQELDAQNEYLKETAWCILEAKEEDVC